MASHRFNSRTRGFSLLELAIAMTVMALLMAGMLNLLLAQLQLRRQEEARNQLSQAREAILAFAAAHGRLPCPASASSRGLESFCPFEMDRCPDAGSPEVRTHGNCSNFYDGYLPAASLGLAPLDEAGFLRDALAGPGGRIRYAVHDTTIKGVPHVLTGSGRMREATLSELVGVNRPTTYLLICGNVTDHASSSNCGSDSGALSLASNIPFVIFSTGPNGQNESGGRSENEAENLDGDRVFVSHPGATGDQEFDDVMTWSSLLSVVDRLMRSGRLP